MDKLRAGAVAAFEGGLAYFCSSACKASRAGGAPPRRPSPGPPAGAPAGAAAPQRTARPGPPPGPVSVPGPEEDAEQDLPEAPASVPTVVEASPSPEEEAPDAPRDTDEPEHAAPRVRRSLGQVPWQVLGAAALVALSLGAPAVRGPEDALVAQLAAAVVAVLWLAVVAALAFSRNGWRAGMEELLVLVGGALPVVAGLLQLRDGGQAGLLATAPTVALCAWLGRWLEARARSGLLGRLCGHAETPEELDRLESSTAILWGDSPVQTTAPRGWAEPAGSKPLSSLPCPSKAELFPRIVALRGEGASPMARGVARAASYLAVLAVPVAAGLLALALASGEQELTPSLVLAAGTALALSPRALRRAWTAPLLSGAERGARQAVLFRDGAALEATARAHWVVFDSRGTLTRGDPTVTSVRSFGGLSEDEVLVIAASAERAAGESMLGSAIVREAEARGLEIEDVRLARQHPGLGVSASGPKGDALLGTRQLLLGEGISVAEAEETAAEMEGRAETVVFLALGGRTQGLISLEDELRPGATGVARSLSTLGAEPVLMTGDSRAKAEALGRKLGFDHVRAEVAPDGWAEQVGSLKDTGHGIAMVARPPRHMATLAAANAGIVLGSAGLEVEAAGVALESEDPRAAVRAVSIARTAIRAAWLNTFVASAQVLIGLGLAWLALGLLQLWVVPGAVALLSSLTAALVSSELLAWRRSA